MRLVLTGLYSARNVPKNLITAHSIVLVKMCKNNFLTIQWHYSNYLPIKIK